MQTPSALLTAALDYLKDGALSSTEWVRTYLSDNRPRARAVAAIALGALLQWAGATIGIPVVIAGVLALVLLAE